MPAPAAPGPADVGGQRPPRALLVAAALGSLVIVAVLVMVLGARGIGWSPRRTTVVVGAAQPLVIASVTASSVLASSGLVGYEPANVLDGDPTTAWNEAADGAGVGEWIEVALAGPAQVTRLVVWNGYQKGAQFSENNRVRTAALDAGGERFLVDLLDVRGPQGIDLPRPVPAERLRLTIQAVYPGDRYPDAALSELQVFGISAEHQPPR